MRLKVFGLVCAGFLAGGPASAELRKIENQSEFLEIVANKTLTRPLIRLQVTSDGRIAGKGAGYPVSGDWSWKGGYFCRSLFWDGDALGYNCQEVRVQDGRVRFTSDKGAGDSAEFRIK